MKIIILIILVVISTTSFIYAQGLGGTNNDSTVNLDILQPPSSPGANLIGVSPSEIQKPTEPKAFVTSLQNATNNFTSLPTSFSVDVAPAWFFGGRNIDYERFKQDNLKENLWQNLVISTALKNDTTDNKATGDLRRTQLGLGFKVSLKRGKINSDVDKYLNQSANVLSLILKNSNFLDNPDEIDKQIASLKAQEGDNTDLIRQFTALKDTLSKYNPVLQNNRDEMRKIISSKGQDRAVVDPSYIQLKNENERIRTEINKIIPVSTENLEKLKKIAQEIKYTRYGLKLDLAGGWAIDFPSQVFDSARVNRFGLWMVGGYEMEKSWSFLGLVRYYMNPEKVFADDAGLLKNKEVNTLDGGARVIFNTKDSKTTFSGEALYRSVLGKQEENNKIDPSWRFTINAGYEFLPGTRLTFAIGRDFNGLVTREGNFIGFLNFLTSFGGNKRYLVR